MESDPIGAAVLGILEGLTEFIPVSSTGHVLLAGYFLGFASPGRAFEVMIQLGAVLAILSVYSARIWYYLSTAPRDARSRRFIAAVLLAFAPAVVVGVAAYDIIKKVLFETPVLIAVMLILGGIVLLFVDRWAKNPRYQRADEFPLSMAFKIGVIQTLSMIPGVSRSGSTIVAALLLGADRRSAAEFSFFLSMPTMLGAFVYDFYKNRDVLDAAAMGDIAIGFVLAFLTAVLVVRWLLGYVSQNGYALFAWWRIVAGSLVLLALAAGR
ncbi:MAG: undecaprenyl-diphosphate phosphatase [Paracoccus sp. (in: a-proteobacteria)]|jgi:undecaprenyl-diphosphatase|nr:undecaprenyl-diphosphatase [Paracoccus sp. (in: a-proteobacteria)]MBA49813.1 undecaprenyl-diphosphatase [Paracoccus sp. (in: a-proteobacteria)]|tara:strand:- start:104 stop:907 length:804 start_codon:yes stop_codon:yes gene_type:complete